FAEEGLDNDLFLIMLLSFIPIFLVVTIVIISTICPIYWLAKNEHTGNKQVFKTFFPYYAVVAFVICVSGIITSGFETILTAFYVSAYITSSQSWVWFAKEQS
ncbi:MAG: hypothetical protein KDD05_10550, partial [Psychroserpens sp.]|nr:hypothetical protein [Psychroserpens sp.]